MIVTYSALGRDMLAKAKRVSDDHPVRELFFELHSVAPYPTGVVEVREQILGTGFFPGGTGIWCEGADDVPQLPVGGVMVLGHNFDKVSAYEKSLRNCTENLNSPTWGNLLPVLERAGVRKEECFFTNVYMGLIEGKATGRFPGANCPDFVKRCEHFFAEQIELQRPRAILALGLHVPIFLARLSPQLSAWTAFKTFGEIDRAEVPVVCDVSFNGVLDHKCRIACLVHPSYRRLNVEQRHWRGLEGDEAEIQMIRKVVSDR